MSIDYDLFIIRSNNRDTTESQMRDCIADAIENLELRIKKLESDNKQKIKTDGPYIKDPKVCKTIRVWGDMNKIEKAYIKRIPGNDSWFRICGRDEAACCWTIEIHASYSETVSKDYRGNMVPINELCGEEEE